jgi:stringent starvation protein B
MSAILPPKKDVALALLERASVFIHLDPRENDVVVPAWLKKQPQLVLQVGLNMAVKIPDLDVGEDAVSCTLSFSRRPQFCSVPWRSIYALVGEDGRGMIWPEDIPAEVAAQADTRSTLRAVESRLGDVSGRRRSRESDPERKEQERQGPTQAFHERRLTAVEGAGASQAREPERAAPGSGPSGSERPYLRLVR